MTETGIIAIVFGTITVLLIAFSALLVKNILEKKDKDSVYAQTMVETYKTTVKDMNDRVMAFYEKAFERYKTEAEASPGGIDKIEPAEEKEEGRKIDLI